MDFVEPPIEETIELNRNYPRVFERYFTEYYYIPTENNKLEPCKEDNSDGKVNEKPSSEKVLINDNSMVEGEGGGDDGGVASEKNEEETVSIPPDDNLDHTCVLVHSNKLCLLTISHHHPILSKRKEITKINYNVGKFNRLENQVSGKGKRGAQMIGPRSALCIITCSDGTSHTILAGVNGKLIEVNERLLSRPQLLIESPKEEGYLAIVLPPLRNGNLLLNRLLAKEQYETLIGKSVKG